MYESNKNIINNQKYVLEDLLSKIDIIWLQEDLTNEQKDELYQLARNKANTDHSINELDKLKKFDKRLVDLEDRVYKIENDGVEPPTTEYPPFEKGKWYYNGNTCSENGKNYICIGPEGQVCVWSPTHYPAYSKEVVETTESEG